MNTLLNECHMDETCSYLENKKQKTHYKIIQSCTKEYCLFLIERGWRRFGNMFFRPVCAECRACESLKIDVQNYNFSKSERRVLKKSSEFNIYIQTPTMSQDHIQLFNTYHEHMHQKKGWDLQVVTARNYHISFVQGHSDFGKEILYFHNDKLIAVDLVDVLDDGISSIYFYYDPQYAKYSLGKLSLLHQIQHAKNQGLAWIYLGYYVEENDSLSYKADYTPYLQLEGRYEEFDTPIWS